VVYIIVSLLLFFFLKGWFRLAARHNFTEKTNERDSRNIVTIQGGGVIFPAAVLLWFVLFGMPFLWFTGGLLLIAIVSLIDDIRALSNRIRIFVHFVAVALMAWQTGLFDFQWYWWLLAFILTIGTINAFNFMDGINAITPFYALTCLAGFYYVNQQIGFTDPDLMLVTGISLILFSFFNARRTARTFAGDVGSVSLTFILCFLMLQLIIATQNPAYMLFFAVYGVDSVLTIIHRLIKRENIFQAHRSHLYQYLANEHNVPQLMVAGLYSGSQLLISFFTLYMIGNKLLNPWALLAITLLVLSMLYEAIRQGIMRERILS